MGCVRVLIAILLMIAACAPSATESFPPTVPIDPPVATGLPSTTTTLPERQGPRGSAVALIEGSAGDAPAVLVYGWDGVSRVEGGAVTKLVEEPVWQAVDDGAGGVVYRTMADEPGWVWLPAGADRPEKIDIGHAGWSNIALVALVDGRPSVLVSRTHDGMSQCEQGDFVEELTIRDLAGRTERFFMCHGLGVDGGEQLASSGGGLLAAVVWAELAGRTATVLSFYDLDGEMVDLEHNPFAESCQPCHLSVALSPDGRQLAYAYWPTAYWPQGYPTDGEAQVSYQEWYEESLEVPTQLVVIDVMSGGELFRAEVSADARVTSFDGRDLVTTTADQRMLVDIASGEFYRVPPETTGQRDFWTVILASLSHSTSTYDQAEEIAREFADDLGVSTGVLWSDGFVSLNPGYWAVFTGHFDTRQEAVSFCERLDTGCYPRSVATADTIDLQTATDRVVLHSDGLGVVSFGASQAEVLTLFERILGSPPTGSYDEAGWVGYVGWEDHGLYLGFSRPYYDEWDGEPRLIGWQYFGGSDEFDLHTEMGVRIGMTLAELRSIYGDELAVHEGSVCGTDVVESYVFIDRPPHIFARIRSDIGVVQALYAGMQTGC